MKDEVYDYIVIGAGAAGLAFTALMEKRGFKVLLLEAHTLPGGCASYFERDGFTFDAGATTLSGLLNDRPMQLLFRELNLEKKLVIKKIDPGIISIIGNKTIRRFSQKDKWLSELHSHFPTIAHEKFWHKIFSIDQKGWIASKAFDQVPLRHFRKIHTFINRHLLTAISLIPSLFLSVQSELNKILKLLKNEKRTEQEYQQMIDELLFITAQNHAKDTPLLMGAMGLSYPEDTAYAFGGMKSVMEALAEKCTNLVFRQRVKKISPPFTKKNQLHFEIETQNKIWKGHRIVSTLPFSNHIDLFEDSTFFKNNLDPLLMPSESWSAFMLYFTIPKKNREGLYYQIHCPKIPHCETHSYFVSLSHPEDVKRSHSNRQTVTISTHTKVAIWENLSKEDYLQRKKEVSQFIINHFNEHFNLSQNEISHLLTGTSKTFKRYTSRDHGLVGGIPHSLRRNLINVISSPSPYKDFYMIGDTQFPGQGIAAVVLGAMNLVNDLAKK
jgi:C-3',4' desaturase CrtD